jgi:tRNA(fMet)-specific endonuclease VapC
MRYMLDTNVVSDIARQPRGLAARKLRQIGVSDIGTSIVVAAEMRYGIARKSTGELAQRIAALLDRLLVIPFESPADQHHGEIRARLEAIGMPIGHNDTFIAAHALALGCILVTDNEREFSRIPRLGIENWLRS